MIAGIGTDIAEVSRIEDKLSRSEHFINHVYSPLEIAYCQKQNNPAMHFAARWAVKEAFLKAFGVKFIGNHKLPEIEVNNDEHGKPSVSLHGLTKKQFAERGFAHIHVSISHTQHYAVAYIIIEK
jgi:holo-[acyl-carrier protein] synthase